MAQEEPVVMVAVVLLVMAANEMMRLVMAGDAVEVQNAMKAVGAVAVALLTVLLVLATLSAVADALEEVEIPVVVVEVAKVVWSLMASLEVTRVVSLARKEMAVTEALGLGTGVCGVERSSYAPE